MKDFWGNVYRKSRAESSFKIGKDPEKIFLNEVIRKSGKNKSLLDIGTGDGSTPIMLSNKFDHIYGIDISRKLIEIASKKKKRNVEFKVADGRNLPFENEKFDVVISQRGPVSENKQFAKEAYRVLKKSGYLIEITIGEKDKENIKRIFGRGQNFNLLIQKQKARYKKMDLLKNFGFKTVKIKEFNLKEYFKTPNDLLLRLNSTPIIPNFSEEKDKKYFEKFISNYSTKDGISTNSHRLIIIAKK